jgi:hypothetical protein
MARLEGWRSHRRFETLCCAMLLSMRVWRVAVRAPVRKRKHFHFFVEGLVTLSP